MISIISHPDGHKRVGDLLNEHLASKQWTLFRAAIAFAKRSGTKHIVSALCDFAKRSSVRISLGVDHCGTSFEAAGDLLTAIGDKGELWIFHNESASRPTFHPKVYFFSNTKAAECLIGSGNLTEGGLFTNYEAFVHLRLNLENPQDEELRKEVENSLDLWTDTATGLGRRANIELLVELKEKGYLPSEAEINRATAVGERSIKGHDGTQPQKIFASVPVKRAPRINAGVPAKRGDFERGRAKPEKTSRVTGFVITLQNTDVGFGQKTPGKARRAAELFVPKVCVQAEPDFWGWPNLFIRDEKRKDVDGDGFGKMDRKGVRMRLSQSTLSVTWTYNPVKKDYRMRNEVLRRAGNIGDILRIELAPSGSDYDYDVEIISQRTSQFEAFAALCTEKVRNSPKKYGYY
jgi:HKD family nuclease